MTTSVQISCIIKDDRFDPYSRIQSVGGVHNGERWRISLDDAITHIERGTYRFYTYVGGHVRNVVVAVSRSGRKYLRTEADRDTPDNLLYLSSCPI